MKKLIFFIGILSISTQAQRANSNSRINIKYDVEDNVIFYKSEWSQSWDYERKRPRNQDIAISAYHINGAYIIVQSNNYKLRNIRPVGFYGKYKITYSSNRKKAVIYYPQLAYHIDHAELFKFNISLMRSRFKPFCRCRTFKHLKHRHVKQ